MRTLTFVLAVLTAAATAIAQPANPTTGQPHTYVVLSLVGDQLEIVAARTQTGTNLEATQRERIPIDKPVFDDAAIWAVAKGIKDVDSNAEVAALNTRSKVLFERQNELFKEQDGVMTMPQAIEEAIAQQKGTRLVLVRKSKEEVRDWGRGTIEGLGLYAPQAHNVNVAFVSVRLTLIDMATKRVLGTQYIKEAPGFSTSYQSMATQDGTAEVSLDRRITYIGEVMKRSIVRAMPALLTRN